MTDEQTQPQQQSFEASQPQPSSSTEGSSASAQSANGQPQGQTPGAQAKSRRRRRKRKNKGGPGQPANGQPQGGAQQPGAQSAQTSAPQAQNQPQNAGQVQGQGQKQAKRFRKKSRGSSAGGQNANPGNQINSSPGNGGGQGRKRKQQRGPKTFVGPMDHSYRASNGNFAEAPPSTIEVHGNGYRGDNYGGNGNGHSYMANGNSSGYQSEPYQMDAMPVSVPHASPTRIVCFIDDLFFIAKIQETARKLGVKVAFVKADKDIVAQLSGDEETRPALIVFDLNNLNAKPLTLIPKLKAKLKKGTSIVGFLSHLQGDLKMKATEAGCDTVMPRSAFSQNLPNLLRRYGMVDELEPMEK